MIVRNDPRFTYAAAALIAVLCIASTISRSEARVPITMRQIFDPSHIVGTWSSSNVANSAVIASAQSLLTTPKIDDNVGVEPAHGSRLSIETTIHSRRVTFTADPIIHFSSYLAPGQRRLTQRGTPGVAWLTERVTLWDDVPVSKEQVSREVVSDAKPGVMLVGTPRTLAQLRAAFPGREIGVALTMVATAYTADTATSAPTGYTATGILAREGVVAVDPRVIPLGTRLFVPGYGIALAADTGGAIIGNRIDLCMDSYDQAVEFGRRTVQVYIIGR